VTGGIGLEEVVLFVAVYRMHEYGGIRWVFLDVGGDGVCLY
jgi:hypothetical protein